MHHYNIRQNTFIISPTGSGKTYYILDVLTPGHKCLYLCDNNNLKRAVLKHPNTVEYGVLNAVGDKATGDVTVTLCAVNQGNQDDDIQLNSGELNDFEGNIYKIEVYRINDFINIGRPNGGCKATARTGIPTKIYITFQKVAVGARIANLHTQEIAHHKGFSTNAYIDFRDINIEWK